MRSSQTQWRFEHLISVLLRNYTQGDRMSLPPPQFSILHFNNLGSDNRNLEVSNVRTEKKAAEFHSYTKNSDKGKEEERERQRKRGERVREEIVTI